MCRIGWCSVTVIPESGWGQTLMQRDSVAAKKLSRWFTAMITTQLSLMRLNLTITSCSTSCWLPHVGVCSLSLSLQCLKVYSWKGSAGSGLTWVAVMGCTSCTIHSNDVTKFNLCCLTHCSDLHPVPGLI